MAPQLKAFLARVSLSDLGILLGLGLCDYALFQWSPPAGWFCLGAIVVGLSVIAGLSPTKRARSAPRGEA